MADPKVQNIKLCKIQTFAELRKIVPDPQSMKQFYAQSFLKSYDQLGITEFLKDLKGWDEDEQVVEWLEGFVEESLMALAKETTNMWLLALDGTEVVGLAIINKKSEILYYLAHLVVHPRFWGDRDSEGRTLGDKLIRFCYSHLPHDSELYLFVRKLNTRAIKFYNRIGAQSVTWRGTVEHYNPEEYMKFVIAIP